MVTKKTKEQLFDMPTEVKNWIELANSRLKHMHSEIDRLKEENKSLKAYRKFAENKITRSEAE